MNRVEAYALEAPDEEWHDSAKTYCLGVMGALALEDESLSLVFTTDRYIGVINQRFRNKRGPTDVLTFCDSEGHQFPEGEGGNYLGDILISSESVLRNCREFGVSFTEELRRVLIHGVLHLVGWIHNSTEPTEPMLLYQEALLKEIGESIK